MPEISRFYGIVIYMFTGDREHNPPHFHAEYQGHKAIFYLNGDVKTSKMPIKQIKLIDAWAEIHQDELLEAWNLAMSGKPLFKIEPLR